MTTGTGQLAVADCAELSPDEGHALFDAAALRLMGISGDDFLSRWDRGEYKGQDSRAIAIVATLIPFGRAHAV